MPVIIASIARAATIAAGLAFLAGCEGPPPEAYVAGANRAVRTADGQPVGANRLGEACTRQSGGADEVLVYCGEWEQPSARLHATAEGAGTPLHALATAGAWRQALDIRFDCGEPGPVAIATGEPALLMSCTQRVGGWPHFALVTIAGGKVWLTDGVDAAEPVIERVIAADTGRGSAAQASTADASQAARRLAAQPVRADDIQRYDTFMLAAGNANRVGDPVAAELAYRRALTVQEKNLGADNPALIETLLGVALQVSTQGRFTEADALFARAAPLVARGAAADHTLPARVLYYRALHTANLSDAARMVAERDAGTPAGTQAQARADALRGQAEALLARADTLFAAALPNAQDTEVVEQDRYARLVGGKRDDAPLRRATMTASDNNGLYGEVEERRYRSILLRDMGRPREAEQVLASARALAQANGIRALDVQARLTRVAASNSAALSRSGDAASFYGTAADTFAAARRDLPRAETELRAAGQLMIEKRSGAALAACRTASGILRELRQGATSELMTPCLAAWAAQAGAGADGSGQALLREMFEAAQLVQSGTTSQQIAATTARLSEGSKDPRIGEAIRKREDVTRQLDRLARDRVRAVAAGADAAALAAIDAKITEQQEARAGADQAMQAASPGYFSLVQDIRPAAEVFAALHPGEVLVSIVEGPEDGWLMALRDGRVTAVPVVGGERRMGVLVRRVRDSVAAGETAPPPFDAAAAREIYAATLGAVEPVLAGADRLVVAPTGALLSIPFGLLVTGPDIAVAGAAPRPPYLIERFAVSHVPAPSSFVSLRRVAPSHAALPWIGFGDFRPPSLAQARATFPTDRCGTAGAQLAQLEQLPASRRELDLTRATLSARPADEILGDAFTSARALADGMQAYHVVHFSTHGIIANAIACQPEPAIITSTPPGAKDASATLLTASQVLDMHLDADAVILSACDTGASAEGGESLSGLARSFFSAGARALMVTQWELSEAVAPTLTAATFQQLGARPELGLAGALRVVQMALIAKAASHEIPAAYGHPFLWAPLVVIGEGGGGAAPAPAARSAQGAPPATRS